MKDFQASLDFDDTKNQGVVCVCGETYVIDADEFNNDPPEGMLKLIRWVAEAVERKTASDIYEIFVDVCNEMRQTEVNE